MDLYPTYRWSQHEGYECSSRGDIRFSALFAKMPDGRSIEMHYQCDIKGYDPGGRNWKLGKGKPPKHEMSHDQLWRAYLDLWIYWASRNPVVMRELRIKAEAHRMCLRDSFAKHGINQARALAYILSQPYYTTQAGGHMIDTPTLKGTDDV